MTFRGFCFLPWFNVNLRRWFFVYIERVCFSPKYMVHSFSYIICIVEMYPNKLD